MPHARLHALIRRIFAAALQSNFYARGEVSLFQRCANREESVLPEFSRCHFKVKLEPARLPLKRGGGISRRPETGNFWDQSSGGCDAC